MTSWELHLLTQSLFAYMFCREFAGKYLKEVLFHLVSLRSIFRALSSQQGLKPKLQSNLVRGQLINQRLARVRSNQWTCEAVGQAGKAGWPQLQLGILSQANAYPSLVP